MFAPATTARFSRSPVSERVLFRCVLTSIALHVMVQIGLAEWNTPAPPARMLSVLTARLTPFAVTPPATEQPPQPPRHAPSLNPLPTLAPRAAVIKPAATPASAAHIAAPADAVDAPSEPA